MSIDRLQSLGWPASRLGEAVSALLWHCGCPSIPAENLTFEDPEEFIEVQAAQYGFEAVPLSSTFSTFHKDVRRGAPLIVQIAPQSFLAIVSTKGAFLKLLGPSGTSESIAIQTLCEAIRLPVEQSRKAEYNKLFAAAGLDEAQAEKSTAALLNEQFGRRSFQGAWTLRPPIHNTGLTRFLQAAGVFRNTAWLIGAHTIEYLLWLAAWAVMGRLSFDGRMDGGWLSGWALLLITTVPFRLATTWVGGILAIDMGAHLKRRLLIGALKLDGEAIRHLGVGSFLSQALESEAVETLALSGGVTGLLALIEVLISGFLLGQLALLLAAWCLILAWLTRRFLQRYESWTGERLLMTGDLVESMAGHRTRVAQLSPGQWHESEDAALAAYFSRSSAIDSTGGWLVAACPRGWLLAGLLWLVPLAISGAASGEALAIKLGGVLLAFTAFKKLTGSAVDIVAAVVAARRIAPLFRSAAQEESNGKIMIQQHQSPLPGDKILEADRITFRYRDEGSPALHPASLTVRAGEKILLEGSSGGGKTTLASLLSGRRNPKSGLLLLQGLDTHTVGLNQWRRRIAAAPQFHENYILTETLAFNLLLGRHWPPAQQDLEEAESVCRELGLGDLLDRMPGGIEQMVGEGGWQLSHGERSRIYVARTLLQKSDVVILDESFGALDPQNLEIALQCTLKRAETLLLIAHP